MSTSVRVHEELALQLFSLHYELKRDPAKTLQWIQNRGFRSVEVAGFGNLSPERFAKILQTEGLNCIGIHAPDIDQFASPNEFASWCFERVEDFSCKYFVIFRDPQTVLNIARDPLQQKKYYHQLASKVDAACASLGGQNIELAYHAYGYDLTPVGLAEELSGLDILFQNISASNFSLQFDTYWAFCDIGTRTRIVSNRGLAVVKKYRDRISSVHVNDFDNEGRDVPFSTGRCPWSYLFKMIGQNNRKVNWILEHEPSTAGSQKSQILTSQTNWGA
jgi:sugar phosphate isomerase/epimerase